MLHFDVSNIHTSLTRRPSELDASGNLTYTLAANANGTALVTINIQDDGGTANGGVDQSANQTFNINVTAVNDAPSFTFQAPSTFVLKIGRASCRERATAMGVGEADEEAEAEERRESKKKHSVTREQL